MRKTQEEKIEDMKAWAEKNYSRGADVMIECWSDSNYLDLLNEQGGSLKKAFVILKAVASVYRDQEADAENSIF